MQHIAAFHKMSILIVKVKKDIQTNEYNILFENYNLTPLDMYNGLTEAYCIKPEGRIH